MRKPVNKLKILVDSFIIVNINTQICLGTSNTTGCQFFVANMHVPTSFREAWFLLFVKTGPEIKLLNFGIY